MKLNRAVKVERELLQRVREIYRESAHFARTHEEHMKAMKAYLWDKAEYRKAPRWLKSAVYGADHTMFALLYSVGIAGGPAPLTSISIGPDGRLFGPKDDSWLQEDHEYKSSMKCAHVWTHRWDKGELKIWS